MGYRYFRSCLDPLQQQAYDLFVNAIQNLDTSLRLPKLSSAKLIEITNALDYDYPEFFYVEYVDKNNYYSYCSYPDHIEYKLHYDIPKEDIRNIVKKIEAIADRLIAKAKASGCRSDLAMAAYLHNYVTDNIGYTTKKALSPKRNHCMLGALTNKECVCEGYAKLYLYLLDRAGVPAIFVYGKTDTQRDAYHAWNMIQINGEWYHTDITWDENARDKGKWEYFMLTESEIKAKNHYLLMEFPVPESSTKPLPLNRVARKLH